MFKNYFTIALRNIKRHRSHSIINIAGLAIALAATIVIFLVLQHEYSYDTYHKNADRIYQVIKKDVSPTETGYQIGVPFPATRALRLDFPQVTFGELYKSYGSQLTVMKDPNTISSRRFIEESGVFFADPEMFSIFDVKWMAGSAAVLKEPGKVVLAKSIAEKYFGTWQSAMDGYLKIDNNILVQVAGIIEDVPNNSDFPFAVIPSYKTFESNQQFFNYGEQINDWGLSTSDHQVYALLPENMNAASIDANLETFSRKYYRMESATKPTHFLQPLKNIHFDTRLENNGDHISNKTSLNTLALIGVLIVLMACINFINLSTALAAKRGKEVGIRKVMGSSKTQLRTQVLFETGLIVLFAGMAAILLAWLALPYLRYIADIQQQLTLINTGSILFLVLTLVVTTILAGFYPSLVLSSFQPVEAIKNKINNTRVGGLSLRRVLVVLQFAFSQLLIIATIIAVGQMNYIRTADIGFDKEAILLLQGNSDSTSLARHAAFKADLLKLPAVKSVSFTMDPPSSLNSWTTNFAFNNNTEDLPFNLYLKTGDEHYAGTFGMNLLAGRFYTTSDSARKVVINETLMQKVGIKEPSEAIGKTIRIGAGQFREIVGVVRDFKNNSLRDGIQPTAIISYPAFYSLTAIKLKSNNLGKSNEAIQQVWDKHYPEYAAETSFLDESINEFYQQEERLSRLYKVYATLAIIISCLGLYGLVSFMAVQKNKEVGIRKVLGASVGSIVYLFSKEFTVLILIAFALAAPAGWYLMNNWLQNFTYRIDIGAWVFILAVLASVLIAWLTVGYKAISAATANPVKSLKSE